MERLVISRLNLAKYLFISCIFASLSLDVFISIKPEYVGMSVFFKTTIFLLFIYLSRKWLLKKSSYREFGIISLLALCLISLLYTYSSSFPLDSLTRTIKLLYWVFTIIMFHFMIHFNTLDKASLKKVLILALMLMIPATLYLIFFPQVEHLAQAAGAYPLLWAIYCAVILLDKKDKLLFILIVIATLTLFLVVKRGAILCLLASVCFWFYLYNTKYITAKKLLRTMLIIVGAILLLLMFFIIRGDVLIERAADTSGSGRDIMYALIILDYFASGTLEVIFGHGALGVQEFTGKALQIREGAKYGLQAHSDWLTLLYDFGLLGAIIFASFHVFLIKKIKQIKSINYPIYCRIMAMYLSLFMVSFFSEIFFSTSLIFLSLYIALVYSFNPNKRNLL